MPNIFYSNWKNLPPSPLQNVEEYHYIFSSSDDIRLLTHLIETFIENAQLFLHFFLFSPKLTIFYWPEKAKLLQFGARDGTAWTAGTAGTALLGSRIALNGALVMLGFNLIWAAWLCGNRTLMTTFAKTVQTIKPIKGLGWNSENPLNNSFPEKWHLQLDTEL